MFKKVANALVVKDCNREPDKTEAQLKRPTVPSPFYNKHRNQCRAAVVGASGTGKTNLLINLIQSKELGPWTRLFIYARNLEDPAYEKLQKSVNRASLITGEPHEDVIKFESDPRAVPTVDTLDKNYFNIVIFDDFVSANKETQAKMSEYFIRGRKQNASVFYLSQSYYGIPKLIRLQCNVFILFKTHDDREIGHWYQTHGSVCCQALGCRVNLDLFRNIFADATRDPYSFLIIDPDCQDAQLRVRKDMNQILINKR